MEEDQKYRQIYEAIEEGRFDRAIFQCQRKHLLRDDRAKALMAYSLFKTRKHSEALVLARDVLSRGPLQEIVLRTLSYTMRALNADEELTAGYEKAFEANQLDIDLGVSVFECYARTFECKKMQLLAQRMYKITADARFVFWSVTSMQISFLRAATPDSTLLMLGERMIEKIIGATTEQLGGEELLMYIEILVKQEKFSEALGRLDELTARPAGPAIGEEEEFKRDPSKVKSFDLFIREKRSFLLEKLKRYDDLKGELYTVLRDYPDQWSCNKQIIDIIYEQDEKDNDWYLSELLGHYNFIVSQQQSYPKLRGPMLAELYLLETMRTKLSGGESLSLPSGWPAAHGPEDFPLDQADATFSGSAENLKEYLEGKIFKDLSMKICLYIRQFYSKPCCFADVRGALELFLTNLSAEKAVEALKIIKNWTLRQIDETWGKIRGIVDANDLENRATMVDDMYRYSSLQYISLFCDHLCQCAGVAGEQSSHSAAEKDAHLQVYFKSKPVLSGGIGGDRAGDQPADELLRISQLYLKREREMANEASVPMEIEANMFARTIKRLHLLSIGCTVSPSNYVFKFDIMEPLRALSAGELALTWFKKLDVKHTLLDSMTYLIFPALLESGLFLEAQRHISRLLNFVQFARRDAAESVAKCFTYSNYMKALEISSFDGRLNISMHAAVGRVEQGLLTLVNSCHCYDDARLYLQQHVIGAAVESQEFLSQQQINSLVDNADYDILVMSDVTRASARAAKDTRRQQLEGRLSVGQHVLKILSTITAGNAADLRTAFSNFISEMGPMRENATYSPVEWSQKIDCGGVEFERCIYNSFIDSVEMALQYRESADSVELATRQEKLSGLVQDFSDKLLEIKTMLDLVSSSDRPMVLKSDELGSNEARAGKGKRAVPIQYPLSPQWIRKISFLAYSLASWVPVVFGSVLSTAPSKKKKGKSKGKASSGPDPFVHIKSACLALVPLLEKCSNVLKSYESIQEKSLSGQLETILPNLKISSGESEDSQMVTILKELVVQLSNSQGSSCLSVGSVLTSKIAALNDLVAQ